jgi:Flp pilus assembly protein protease CpaA
LAGHELLDSQCACPAFFYLKCLFLLWVKELYLIINLVLLVLLFICMIYDLKDREVPMPLTLGSLVGAGILGLFHGLWSPVLLTIALTHVADFNPREKRLAFALTLSAFAGIFQPDTALLCAVILSIWMLWEFGIMGGADVKLLIAITIMTGNATILIPIAVAGGIQGVIASLRKQREIPFVVSIFCGALFFVLFPLI